MKMQSSLRTFAWLSHERPEALRRSIDSFVKGVGATASSYKYIIAESGAFQKAPDYIPSENVVYINDSYREKMITYLETGLRVFGCRKDPVRFALDASQPEGSEGVHRNAISLLTQEELFACADDDVIFDLQSLPESAKVQTAAGAGNFIPFKNFAELSDFEGRAKTVAVADFIAAHENALQSVTFSSPGIRGDSAYGGPRFIFTFDDSSLAAVCQNKDFVSEALGSRLMWRETAKSHIVPYASLATYMLGMNGQKGLAPCFPFGRNVDGAFVYATKSLHPSSQTAHLNVSVSHRPVTDRGAYASLNELEFRINDLLWLVWSEWLQSLRRSLDTEERYKMAATYFQHIAELPSSDFREYLLDLAERSLSDRANRLEAQIERLKSKEDIPGLPAWIHIAKNEIDLCRKIVSQKTLLLPVESYRKDRTPQERLALTQKWIRSYGQLIEAWPLMRFLTAQEDFCHIFNR